MAAATPVTINIPAPIILPNPSSVRPTGPMDRLRLLSLLEFNNSFIGFFEKIFLLIFSPIIWILDNFISKI